MRHCAREKVTVTNASTMYYALATDTPITTPMASPYGNLVTVGIAFGVCSEDSDLPGVTYCAGTSGAA